MGIRSGTIVPVVGVTFYQDAVRVMREGDSVTLSHDTGNEDDPNAMIVRNTNGETLGYLPKVLAPRFTHPDSGGTVNVQWTGTVCELTRHEESVGLRIRLDEQLEPSN